MSNLNSMNVNNFDLAKQDSGDSDEWEEVIDDVKDNYICLVCPHCSNTPDEFFIHLKVSHQWINFLKGEDISLIDDQYAWIRFVNFVRKTLPADLRKAYFDMSWKTDSIDLLYPVLTNDEVLAIDIEHYLSSFRPQDEEYSLVNQSSSELIRRLEEENAHIRSELAHCKRLLTSIVSGPVQPALEESHHSADNLVINGNKKMRSGDSVSSTDSNQDSAYFGSYGHFEIHGEMITDRVRTGSYRNFILHNAEAYFQNKYVLDVGSGSGILSIFAKDAGAKHVYGVEASVEIFSAAEESIRINNLGDHITIIRERVEAVILPVKQVDVIISEWMGYFLFFESMLDSVLNVAQRYLKPDGHIFPRHYDLCLLAVQCDRKVRLRYLDHWSDVYGYQMPALRRAALNEAHVINLSYVGPNGGGIGSALNVNTTESTEQVDNSSMSGCLSSPVITLLNPNPIQLLCLDLKQMHMTNMHQLCPPDKGSLICSTDFCLTIDPALDEADRDGKHLVLDAFVGYFDVRFDDDAPNPVTFSTSPLKPSTHWKQTLFFLDKPIPVSSGDVIKGTVCVKRSKLDNRGLDISISLNSPDGLFNSVYQTYNLVS